MPSRRVQADEPRKPSRFLAIDGELYDLDDPAAHPGIVHAIASTRRRAASEALTRIREGVAGLVSYEHVNGAPCAVCEAEKLLLLIDTEIGAEP